MLYRIKYYCGNVNGYCRFTFIVIQYGTQGSIAVCCAIFKHSIQEAIKLDRTIDLSRFTKAHQWDYASALQEIKNGRKQTHWMWYIFPQIHGLGRSSTAARYAIRSIEEAVAFLQDPYLGNHLTEISLTLLTLTTNDPFEVFGYPDHLKLRSCMTLFALISEKNSVFEQVLQKYFNGAYDQRTLNILHWNSSGNGS